MQDLEHLCSESMAPEAECIPLCFIIRRRVYSLCGILSMIWRRRSERAQPLIVVNIVWPMAKACNGNFINQLLHTFALTANVAHACLLALLNPMLWKREEGNQFLWNWLWSFCLQGKVTALVFVASSALMKNEIGASTAAVFFLPFPTVEAKASSATH